VVAVAQRNVLLYHEEAWVAADECIEQLTEMMRDLRAVEVKESEIPLADAISSYFFNSQLVTVANGSIALIAPMESRQNERVHEYAQSLVEQGIVASAHYVDVRESMRNGGGPACLRLRVQLNDEELAATHQGVLFEDVLHAKLT